MTRLGIPSRTNSESKSRSFNPNWRGGKKRDKNGYILIHQPEHPNASGEGYVFEHRLIAEKAIGRKLRHNENPHHINGIVDDNRNSNLLICTNSYHTSLHYRMRKRKELGIEVVKK